MDKLTSAFSGGSPSPTKSHRRHGTRTDDSGSPHSRSDGSSTEPKPQPTNPFSSRGHGCIRVAYQRDPRDHQAVGASIPGRSLSRPRADSPSKRSRSPAKNGHYRPESPEMTCPSPTIAERRQGPMPSPINVKLAEKLNSTPRRGPAPSKVRVYHSAPERNDPPSPIRVRHHQKPVSQSPSQDDSSSIYSNEDEDEDEQDTGNLPHISPLRIKKPADPEAEHDLERRPSVLRDYATWADSSTHALNGDGARGMSPPPSTPEHGAAISQTGLDNNNDDNRGDTRDVYSPLAPFAKGGGNSITGKGRKVMIGSNGWLERTGKTPDKKPSPLKKGGFLDALKRMAKEVAEVTDMKASRRAKEAERDRRTSRLKISLDPREQSLLYCELEFILTSALDSYINSQFNAGRLDADKYKKIADSWQQKGRPKVVGFRYDLETQLELVHLHIQEFKFYGDRSGVAVAVAGVLEMMKVNARAMRIRTFCQPDSVIAKQLLDSQGLFNILGCSEPKQIQLAEVIQFFKTILEREKHFHGEGTEIKASSTSKSLSNTPGT